MFAIYKQGACLSMHSCTHKSVHTRLSNPPLPMHGHVHSVHILSGTSTDGCCNSIILRLYDLPLPYPQLKVKEISGWVGEIVSVLESGPMADTFRVVLQVR